MALPTVPTYSTHAEFVLNTPIASQSSILEADWIPLALRAESIIDSYVNCVNSDPENDRKFPEEGEEIPNDITLATIEITSFLIAQDESTILDPVSGESQSESWSATAYSKDKGDSTSVRNANKTDMGLPPLATRLLMPWCINSAPATF